MIKRFPNPRGLHSKSYASRYADLRKIATRRAGSRSQTGRLLPSDRPPRIPRPKADTGMRTFAAILLVTTMALVALVIWSAMSG